MLRFACGLLITAVSILIGYYLTSRLSRRRAILDDYIALLEEAANRMSYTGEKLAAVFSDNFAGYVFDADRAFSPQWEEMADRFRDVLKADDLRALRAFAHEIGQGDVPSELNRIRLYQSILRERLDDARAACEKKGALYRILPFAIGLSITILLL